MNQNQTLKSKAVFIFASIPSHRGPFPALFSAASLLLTPRPRQALVTSLLTAASHARSVLAHPELPRASDDILSPLHGMPTHAFSACIHMSNATPSMQPFFCLSLGSCNSLSLLLLSYLSHPVLCCSDFYNPLFSELIRPRRAKTMFSHCFVPLITLLTMSGMG